MKSNEILLILTPWFDAQLQQQQQQRPSKRRFVGNSSFDFMQNMIFNRSSIFYQKVMFCNKYNGILPFFSSRSSLFATCSGRFSWILLAGSSIYTAGVAFGVFHVFFDVFVNFHKNLSFFLFLVFTLKPMVF